MFVHLHTRSHYSFLQGLASPQALASAASRAGMPALALTDRLYLTGAVEFHQACRAAGVRPLLGIELPVAAPHLDPLPAQLRTGSLVLLAMDLVGWGNLCRLSSLLLTPPRGQSANEAVFALPFRQLGEHTAGLICLTGGRAGQVTQLAAAGQERLALEILARLAELFPQRLYVELQLHAPEDRQAGKRLAALAGGLNLPVVATHTVSYLAPDQIGLARLAAAVRLNRPLSDLPAEALPLPEAHFLDGEQMRARFAEYPQALAATLEVAGRCQLDLPLGQPHFPQLDLPQRATPDQVLRAKAEAGALERYGDLTSTIRSRLDHELQVIASRGYAPLFLVMQDVIDQARKLGVPISSRGSAASSLVAHCLKITSPDPIRLNLYFERFLNPARASPPDIDTDLCSRRRDEVIGYVYERYGSERVAMVCTINRFRRRSALRETAKAYGISPAQVKSLADQLPQRWWGPRLADSDQGPFAVLQKRYSQDPYPAVFRDAAALLGLPHHLSIHPGGIVIAPGPLTDLAPTLRASKGVVITQFDLESVAALGLVKLDLLGIRGLTVLGDVAGTLYQRNPPAFQGPLDALDAIPDGDPLSAELVRAGRTIGCFQIESPGMRATLKEIQAQSVDDLMVALALYRPGPLTGGLKDAFVRRHRGLESPEHLHPALAPLLDDTYGVILYQEQVLRIAHELAGLSLADADLLRRAMSHFDPGEQMRTLKERFIAGAAARSGVPPPVAERIWQLMAAFAGYGFPKAHAASYALVSWRAAWCKAHEPATFMAAVLANWGGYYGQSVYLTESRRMGLALGAPHVNHARPEFSVSYLEGRPVLFMGLDQVRDLTRRTQARILRERPFRSLQDFLARADPRPLEAENLIRAGALEGFGPIPRLLSQIQGRRFSSQLSLFDDAAPSMRTASALPRPSAIPAGPDDWDLLQKVEAQEAVLGVSVIAHRLELLADEVRRAGAINTLEVMARIGERARVAGVRQSWLRGASERGETVYLMSFEDLEGMLEVLIPSRIYRRHRAEIAGARPFLVEGEVSFNPATGEPFIRAERLARLGV